MKIEFKLPELGENISSADVVRVLVREGDLVAVGAGVAELETEKPSSKSLVPWPARLCKFMYPKVKRSRWANCC
jgi:pyruvate dehydrogenase E2 component (dihydrolipoamide acetyltransferase)